MDYRTLRREWIKSHSYFRHFWRFASPTISSLVAGMCLWYFKMQTLAAIAISVSAGVIVYFACWGIDYFVTWGWKAPEAIHADQESAIEYLESRANNAEMVRQAQRDAKVKAEFYDLTTTHPDAKLWMKPPDSNTVANINTLLRDHDWELLSVLPFRYKDKA